jgi:hypothetical protein
MVLLFINCTFIMAALIGVTFAKTTYERWYQQPLCFREARAQAVPDLEYLHFEQVTIATDQYHGHDCSFIDTRTGAPVLVRFEEADIPISLDTLQVCFMIMPVIISGLIATLFWERYYRRAIKRR